ncbi:hypothetical protein LG047_17715 [Methylocystis sp. WRRC1]|uniref:hypothetical protein n=1 Tax=Methylocystis sp. WRRC1 TaxID=1732014 RepID=UPI001D13C520|nr:hypothetical protein [Methylocystis sp. WRRC1]MCC3247128.1 hypothetical protein [Methylocystis sp. WRRC1]
MGKESAIEMRRMKDGAVYRFVAAPTAEGAPRYRREDKDVWIMRDPAFGWIVWDGENKALMGRPWDVAPSEQGDLPPACEWVSKRGGDSFVYQLVFV